MLFSPVPGEDRLESAVLTRPVLALIPARSGSKGIPRQDLLMVGRRPVVERTDVRAMIAYGGSRVACVVSA